MCEQCDVYAETVPVDSLVTHAKLLSRARKAEAEGVLEAMDASHPAEDFALDRTWPTDELRHTWVCTRCSRLFLLEANTRHVSGDSWRPLFGN
jgi:hypothetical protein